MGIYIYMQIGIRVHEQVGKANIWGEIHQERGGGEGGAAAEEGGRRQLVDAAPPHRNIFSDRARMGDGWCPNSRCFVWLYLLVEEHRWSWSILNNCACCILHHSCSFVHAPNNYKCSALYIFQLFYLIVQSVRCTEHYSLMQY